jgi:hypothetical protein
MKISVLHLSRQYWVMVVYILPLITSHMFKIAFERKSKLSASHILRQMIYNICT